MKTAKILFVIVVSGLIAGCVWLSIPTSKLETIKPESTVEYVQPDKKDNKAGELAQKLAEKISSSPNEWTEKIENDGIFYDAIIENKNCNIKIKFNRCYLGYTDPMATVTLPEDSTGLNVPDSKFVYDAYFQFISAPRYEEVQRKERIANRAKEILRENKEKRILKQLCSK